MGQLKIGISSQAFYTMTLMVFVMGLYQNCSPASFRTTSGTAISASIVNVGGSGSNGGFAINPGDGGSLSQNPPVVGATPPLVVANPPVAAATPPPIVAIPPIENPTDILARNSACPLSANFLGAMPLPSTGNDVSLRGDSGNGLGSIVLPEAGQVDSVQLRFDLMPNSLRIENAKSLGRLVQTKDFPDVCIGTHGAGNNPLTQNDVRVLTLVNRGDSPIAINDIGQENVRELHLIGFQVRHLNHVQNGSLAILLGSSVENINQNHGKILIKSSTPVSVINQNQGEIKIENNSVGHVHQMRADGIVEISGGTIDRVTQSAGKIILRNGARILSLDASSTVAVIEE